MSNPLALLVDYLIGVEVRHQHDQDQYFRQRAVVGPILSPLVWQPKLETPASALVAIFVQPGAVHLVFADEIHPNTAINKAYRPLREKAFGRVHDVKSLEVTEDYQLYFPGSGSGGVNLYETSLHVYTTELYKGSIFSDTWNHLVSGRGAPAIRLRGGYELKLVPVLQGSRDSAEQY